MRTASIKYLSCTSDMLKHLALALSIIIGSTALAQTSKGTTDNYFEISKNLDIYYALFKEVNQLYVDPIQPGQMVKTSVDAMLNKLDPYTNYITEDDIEEYRFQTTGKYGGIGSGLRKLNGYLVIDEPLENGPIAKSGIKSGDIILEIDGKSVKGFEIEDVSKLVKGSPNTPITLKLRNSITNAEFSKTINREEISINNTTNPSLVGSNKEFAYVKLTQFTDRASANIKAALDSLKKANPSIKGVILDLRFNPGGLLDEGVALCNLFIPRDQLVVSTKGKVEEWVKDYKTKSLSWDENIPLAILVNKGSASASEIVAGTIQDLDRGVVIGQRSYGKGLVQTTRNLPFNAKIKVTTAKYYTPSGRCIQALDYSHRNEDGSVGAVADSLKKEFKTKIGRKVFDGGGIDPDIKTSTLESHKVVSALYSDGLIFEYGTKYASEHNTIAAPKDFKLTDADVEDFIKWLDTKTFTYKTKTEDALDKVKTQAEKENYLDKIKTQLESLQAIVAAEKKQDLLKSKRELRKALQADIVSRYYYQTGKVANMMNDDEELKEAINVLGDAARYGKLLGK
jgi:carboxyl-terminal processing protease